MTKKHLLSDLDLVTEVEDAVPQVAQGAEVVHEAGPGVTQEIVKDVLAEVHHAADLDLGQGPHLTMLMIKEQL